MTSVSITPTAEGFATSFPIELKNSFKAAFKTARWNPVRKAWETGTRSGKKLEAWKTEAEKAVVALIEQSHLNDEDCDLSAAIVEIADAIEAVNATNARMAAELETKKEELRNLVAVNALLDAKRDAINAQEAELKSFAEEIGVARKTSIDRLSSIISLDAITATTRAMAKFHNPQVGSNRSQFAAAQRIIDEARDNLRKAGIGSKTLNYLSQMNYNRPDRDMVAYAGDLV